MESVWMEFDESHSNTQTKQLFRTVFLLKQKGFYHNRYCNRSEKASSHHVTGHRHLLWVFPGTELVANGYTGTDDLRSTETGNQGNTNSRCTFKYDYNSLCSALHRDYGAVTRFPESITGLSKHHGVKIFPFCLAWVPSAFHWILISLYSAIALASCLILFWISVSLFSATRF